MRRLLRSWLRRQLFSFFSSLGTLFSHRVSTLMTVMVLGIAMFLPIGLYVTMDNLRGIDLQKSEFGSVTAFLRDGTTEPDVSALIEQINQRGGASAIAISPQQGLEEFRLASGFGSALDVLEANPLPWVVMVKPQIQNGVDLAGTVSGLGEWLNAQPVVESVELDYKWMQRLNSLLDLGNRLVSILTIMFSAAVIVVVANTIRMDVANRAHEIEVLALVGAGDGFIRQPFLYSGFWYGLLGSGLALVLLHACLAYLHTPLGALLDAYGNSFQLKRPNAPQLLLVLTLGGLLGLFGAWVAVVRYLKTLRQGGLLGRL